MKNKIWIYVVGGIIVLLLIGIVVFSSGILNKNASKNSEHKQKNSSLDKYRSENIPEDCRLPNGDSDVGWWKQHLSHHEPTWYCLKYYGTSIEEMKGGK